MTLLDKTLSALGLMRPCRRAMPAARALAVPAEPLRVSSLRASIAIAAALSVAGCNPPGKVLTESETGDLGRGNTLREWADPKTGCVYLIYANNQGNASTGGMTIRFRADGSADCPAQETPTRQRQDRNGLGPQDGGPVAESDAPETSGEAGQ